jgi:hypothetical protein
MNWEAVGAVAELLGAIGVIGSLVYLAKQIKANSDNVTQNTKALISNRDISSNESVLEIMGSQIRNPDLAALTMKGNSGSETLSDVERYQYSMVLSSMFESHQTFYIQQRGESISPELWAYYSNVFDGICRSPGVRTWWEQNRERFNPSFSEYIQKKISVDV